MLKYTKRAGKMAGENNTAYSYSFCHSNASNYLKYV